MSEKRLRLDAMIRQSELGEQLKYLRRITHFSVRDLSKLIGLSKKTIWKLESGRSVNLSTLMIVLEALKYETEFIKIGNDLEREEFGLQLIYNMDPRLSNFNGTR
ncbi:helix-turn-helix transcriptional regulator [Candidatus Dojkabacteria bacterium]|nr:helix-turn-helix transcriptional regulator [Candidatus Dojkabacteria bacterium]